MAKGNYKIPFDQNGNQLDYPEASYGYVNGVLWSKLSLNEVDNFVFEDILTFKNHIRGRSSITFIFERALTSTTISMFVSDFSTIVPQLVDGKVSGKFTFRKQGSNFGCYKIVPD